MSSIPCHPEPKAKDLMEILRCAQNDILKILLIFMACFSLSSAAHAQDTSGFFSGAYLQKLCERDAKGKEIVKGGHTACQAYIAGTIDYHKLMKSLGTAPTIDFCVPNTEKMSKLQDIVWIYLKENGQHTDFIAAPAVTLALYEYYPCPKKSSRRRR